jgi:hypothetical protein
MNTGFHLSNADLFTQHSATPVRSSRQSRPRDWLLSTQHSYILPLRKAKTKITAGPARTISATESSWKTTSQLTLVKALIIPSNIFLIPPNGLKKLDNQSVAKPVIDHIWQRPANFNLLNKIIGKDIKWRTGNV